MNTSADLLNSLKIDRNAPPPVSRKGLWITLAIIAAVLVLAIAAWFLFGRDKGIEVRTAEVVAIGNGGASSASVLDATGYVVARRMATVSAKVTGKVREILIEEGQRVEAGQVMATLDPIDAEQQRALSASQLQAARSQAVGVQAQLKEAEANAARLGALVGQKLVSRAQFEQAIAIYNFGQTAWVPDNLTVELPKGMTAFTTQAQMSDVGVDPTPTGYRLRGTITPGRHDVQFRFQLPYDADPELKFQLGLPPHMALARVVSGTTGPAKLWPVEHFAILARRLADRRTARRQGRAAVALPRPGVGQQLCERLERADHGGHEPRLHAGRDRRDPHALRQSRLHHRRRHRAGSAVGSYRHGNLILADQPRVDRQRKQ